MLDQQPPSSPSPVNKVQYESLRELVSEWQASNDERPLWEYLGVSESIFKDWAQRTKDGIIDA